MQEKVERSEGEWLELLGSERYEVLRKKGTERPFTGELLHNKQTGMYTCGACGAELFTSDAKYDSGSGWPSFFEPADADNVELRPDDTGGMVRTEVVCAVCGGHLGHVFEDGPKPTGLRYCINSCSLGFEPGSATSEG